MDKSGDKNGTAKTIDETPKDIYVTNVIPILIQNANDQHMTKRITEELEMVRLTREHAEADKMIAEKLEIIKKQNKRSAELDRQIYNKTQMEKQTRSRIKTTGEIFHALKEEAEKLKTRAANIETRRLEITKKVQDCTKQRQENEGKKEKIASLEKQIKELLDAPEVTLNEDLVKTNEVLKERLQQKKAQLEIGRKKKAQIARMKEEKLNLLMMINKRQEENATKREEKWKKTSERKQIKEEWTLKCDGLEAKITTAIDKSNELTRELTESVKRSEEKNVKIEEQKRRIAQKEIELEDFKKKCAVQREFVKAENERKQKEFKNEKDKLAIADAKLQAKLEENARNVFVLSEKTEKLSNLKSEKEKLTVKVCEQKIQLLTGQFDNSHQQRDIDLLAEKLNSKRNQVGQLKGSNEELEKKLQEIQEQLEKYPQELAEKRRQIETNHQENMKILVKQKNFETANMEIVQVRLDMDLGVVEKLKDEIKEFEDQIEWQQLRLVRKQTTLVTVRKMVKREQLAYEKLQEKYRQTVAQKSEKMVAEDEAELIKENMTPIEDELGAISKNKGPLKVIGDLDLIEMIENNNPEDKASTSGRKSPGILKRAKEPRSPQTPTKRVTFCGISSTESASSSEPRKAAQSLKKIDDLFDDLVEDCDTSTPRKCRKRAPFDF